MTSSFKLFLVSFLVSVNLFAAIPKTAIDFSTELSTAQNTKKPMSVRWQALINAADVAQYAQIEEIKAFAKSKEWYMRNAALVALEKINVNHAEEEAQLLIKDKALVVRSAAVDVLAKRFTRENRNLMALELSKPYNFAGKQSLWIRSKIFNVIAAKASSGDRPFFVKYLFDNDEKISQAAAATLERITDVNLSDKNKVNEWRNYVKKQNWL